MLATYRKEYPIALASLLLGGCVDAGFGASSPTPFCVGADCIVPESARMLFGFVHFTAV